METRQCQNCKQSFTIEPDDFGFYEKMQVPPPTWCPECRMIRRFLRRNQHLLFRRQDSRTGQQIFSTFPPASTNPIYEISYWNSDNWDPLEYGKDFNPTVPFLTQLRDLLYKVPWPSRGIINLVNSDYSANATDLKNCYLCFDCSGGENSAYLVGGSHVKESFDLYQARHTELSYEGYMIDECYQVFQSVNIEDCHNVWFSRNLIGCQNCFGCVNLRNKSYYIFNKPSSKEAYREFMEKFESGSYRVVSEMREKAEALWGTHPMRFTLGINNMNCTGEHIEHSKNVLESFMVHEGENLKYCQFLEGPVADSYDYITWGAGSSQIYECLQVGDGSERIKFSDGCWPGSSGIEYSLFCRSSHNLFGCVGLKKKQYCILNKQYSKEEYESWRNKIIKHMNDMPYTDTQGRVYRYGEFFPPEFSPFAYNETIAQDFFPLTKEQAEAKGYLWREPDVREHQTTKDAKDLPDNIKDVADGILKEIIKCESCGKAYRIIPMELAFYRRIPLPLPHRCVECRFKDRFRFVNPPKLWPSKCHCGGTQSAHGQAQSVYVNTAKHFHGENHCSNEFQTSYKPGRPEIVYCETCYQSEVV
jgi:hypothetical protein